VQHDFLNELSRILVTGGFFHAATDWENYAEHIVEKLNENPHFSLADASAHEENRPRTKFEDRGLRLGHKVTDIVGLNRIA
jgi:tRNA (guanine-N7-)-methyltransferase